MAIGSGTMQLLGVFVLAALVFGASAQTRLNFLAIGDWGGKFAILICSKLQKKICYPFDFERYRIFGFFTASNLRGFKSGKLGARTLLQADPWKALLSLLD